VTGSTNYVADYRRLDDNAARAESQAEQYRQRADTDRWEQCCIAFEATRPGGYTQRAFAEAVGKSQGLIGSQARAWKRYESRAIHDRPSYEEAMNAVSGDSTEQKIARSAATHIRRLAPEDKAKLAAELLDDPDVEVAPSAIARQAARPDVARAIARDDEAREAIEVEAIEHRARHQPDDVPDPATAGRQAGHSMARRLNTDLATAALRAAAGNVAEAILLREEFGVQNATEWAEAVTRIRHLVASLEDAGGVSDDDRGWLASIGVEL